MPGWWETRYRDGWDDLIVETHRQVNQERMSKGKAIYNFAKDKNMNQEMCELCKDAGFPNNLAHYKSVDAGRAHDGKRKPAMCFDHAQGKTPKAILKAGVKDGTIVKPKKTDLSDTLNNPEVTENGKRILSKDEYEQLYGVMPMGEFRYSKDGIEVWKHIIRLTEESAYYIHPVPEGRDLHKYKNALFASVVKMIKNNKSSFKVRMTLNSAHRHIVMWKEEVDKPIDV